MTTPKSVICYRCNDAELILEPVPVGWQQPTEHEGALEAAKRAGWARHYHLQHGTRFVCPTCRTRR